MSMIYFHVTWMVRMGTFVLLFIIQGGNAMKVNARTIKMILELIAAVAIAAGDVIVKYYLDTPGV
jgi:hypothetical protein